jgi:hypothetical protein
MPAAVALLATLGAPALLGAAIVRALGIGWRTDRLAFLGWAWMAGTLGTALVVYGFAWTGLPLAGPLPLALVLGLALGIGAWARTRERLPPDPLVAGNAGETWLFRLVLAFVLAVTLEHVLRGTLVAVVTTDEGAFWALRAKILFHAGGFGAGYDQAVRDYALANPDYPLVNPLLQLFAFANAGEITHVLNRVPLQAFAPALVLVLAAALRRVTRPLWAAGILLLASAMEPLADGAHLAYTDVPLALGALVLFDAALRFEAAPRFAADARGAWLGLGALALTSVLGLKHDGLFVLAGFLAAALAALLSRRVRGERATWPARRAAWVLAPLGMLALTWLTNVRFSAANQMATFESDAGPLAQSLGGNFLASLVEHGRERAAPLARFFVGRILLDTRHSQGVLVAAGILALLGLRFAPRGLRLAALALGVAFACGVLVFLGTPYDLAWHLDTASGRVAFQIVPATMLFLGACSGTLHASRPAAGRLVALVLAAFLAWRGVAALSSSAPELVAHAPDTVARAFTLSEEARIESALEATHASESSNRDGVSMWNAIRAHVPPEPERGGTVYAFLDEDDVPLAKVLRNLGFPRRFELVKPPASGLAPEVARAHAGGGYVLDMAGEPWLADAFDLVAGGPGWSLWH